MPSGWDVEISLDVQAAHEICQNCKILLVEAKLAEHSDLGTAVNTAVAKGANVGQQQLRLVRRPVGHRRHRRERPTTTPGTRSWSSAGDCGFGPAFPADLNTVVAVGGTNLRLGPGNTYVGETRLEQRPAARTRPGSGCDNASLARVVADGAHRTGRPTGCGSFRAMNDVSADADPNTGAAVYDSRPHGLDAGRRHEPRRAR